MSACEWNICIHLLKGMASQQSTRITLTSNHFTAQVDIQVSWRCVCVCACVCAYLDCNDVSMCVCIWSMVSRLGSRCAGAATGICLLRMSWHGRESKSYDEGWSHVDGRSKCSMKSFFCRRRDNQRMVKKEDWQEYRSWIKNNYIYGV